MWFLKLTMCPLKVDKKNFKIKVFIIRKVKVTKDSMIVFLYKGKIIALYDLAELLVLNVKAL